MKLKIKFFAILAFAALMFYACQPEMIAPKANFNLATSMERTGDCTTDYITEASGDEFAATVTEEYQAANRSVTVTFYNTLTHMVYEFTSNDELACIKLGDVNGTQIYDGGGNSWTYELALDTEWEACEVVEQNFWVNRNNCTGIGGGTSLTVETSYSLIGEEGSGPEGIRGGNFTNGFELNTACGVKLISVTPCSAVAGATINDDAGTADGVEYDWEDAASYMSGGTTQALVEIGGQCWFRRNADNIPATYDPVPAWEDFNGVGWSGYYTGGPHDNEGRLYQWSAAMNGASGAAAERAQGVCPTGWHLPSDCEWMYLEHSLGMSVGDQVVNEGFRDSGSVGTKLKSGGSSGFTALLAGYRTPGGTFFNRGTLDSWWSSSETSASNAQYRSLFSSEAGVNRGSLNKANGLSVRCLKD